MNQVAKMIKAQVVTIVYIFMYQFVLAIVSLHLGRLPSSTKSRKPGPKKKRVKGMYLPVLLLAGSHSAHEYHKYLCTFSLVQRGPM